MKGHAVREAEPHPEIDFGLTGLIFGVCNNNNGCPGLSRDGRLSAAAPASSACASPGAYPIGNGRVAESKGATGEVRLRVVGTLYVSAS